MNNIKSINNINVHSLISFKDKQNFNNANTIPPPGCLESLALNESTIFLFRNFVYSKEKSFALCLLLSKLFT